MPGVRRPPSRSAPIAAASASTKSATTTATRASSRGDWFAVSHTYKTVVAPTSAPAARAQFLLLPGFEPDRSDGLRVRQRSRDRTRRAVVGRVVVRARDHPEMVTHGDTHGCP